jgi:Protein kinase domain
VPPVLESLGQVLGDRYRPERELGAGGMAIVFLAADLRHARQVALKVLRPEIAAALGAERFLQEIRVTANLQHPNILSLFDSGQAGDLLYYVMPFVDGESLRQKLNRERQLPLAEAIRITADVGAALGYAHRQGVIHRDIKPENVMPHQCPMTNVQCPMSKVQGSPLGYWTLDIGHWTFGFIVTARSCGADRGSLPAGTGWCGHSRTCSRPAWRRAAPTAAVRRAGPPGPPR